MTGSPLGALSLEQLIWFFWKVKTWRLDLSFTITATWEDFDSNCDPFDPPQYLYTDHPIAAQFDLSARMAATGALGEAFQTSESELVCRELWGWRTVDGSLSWKMTDLPDASDPLNLLPTVFVNPNGPYGLEFLFGIFVNNVAGSSRGPEDIYVEDDGISWTINLFPTQALPLFTGYEFNMNLEALGATYSVPMSIAGILTPSGLPLPASDCAYGPSLQSADITAASATLSPLEYWPFSA